jgi:pimeloyl-ACP methyl ester carboxylesterase
MGAVGSMLKLLAGATVLLLVGGLLALALLQRRLLYFPSPAADPATRALAARLGVQAWRDPHGGLRGWRVAPAAGAARARLLVLHGNAGCALDRLGYLVALAPRGLEVVLLEYPGYGGRAGTPGAAALTEAALEAVDALAAEGGPVWLLGESLGSGVAARAALARPGVVRALLLVTPFADLAEVMRIHYPVLPSFLLADRYRPARDLAAFAGPVFLLAAGQDEVTTLGQAEALEKALPGPKRLVVQPGASHNGLDLSPGLPTWDEAVAFLAAAR